MDETTGIKERFARVADSLDERTRRLVAASEALALGWGGISATSRATGLSRTASRRGIAELQGAPAALPGRIRPAQASGTRSNIACSRSSRRTGEGSRW